MRRIVLAVAALALPVVGATTGVIADGWNRGCLSPGDLHQGVRYGRSAHSPSRVVAVVSAREQLVETLFPAGGGTITWKGHHNGTTTLGNVNFAPQGQGGCKTGSAEQDITGTVSADTSKANLVGTAVSGRVCVDSAGNQSLVKHTTFTL